MPAVSMVCDDGQSIEFHCEDTFVSAWVNRDILKGETYPYLPFVDDVGVVFDVGANCGAASVHFARHYPHAAVHAFEPARSPRLVLECNARAYANIHPHPIGLHAVDQVVPLYEGATWSGMASVLRRDVNSDKSELVELRSGGAWAAEHGIERLDVLKIDVEGCEVDVLESITALVPTVKICYIEYDSRGARRAIERLLADTHELYIGKVFLDQGECTYLRKDYAALDAANACLLAMWRGAKDSQP